MLARELRFNFKSKLPRNTLSFPSFNIRYDKNELGKIQIGVVVSKKVDKRATARNRLKRVLLEEIRKKMQEDAPISAIFYIKNNADEEALLKDFNEALEKITLETKVSG